MTCFSRLSFSLNDQRGGGTSQCRNSIRGNRGNRGNYGNTLKEGNEKKEERTINKETEKEFFSPLKS